jgi:hypothetical protein
MMAIINMGRMLCMVKGKVKRMRSAWRNEDVREASCCHRLCGTLPAPEDIIGTMRDKARARRRRPRGTGL